MSFLLELILIVRTSGHTNQLKVGSIHSNNNNNNNNNNKHNKQSQ